jgi:ABC-type antimicrobial peptide transport system permease subunit
VGVVGDVRHVSLDARSEPELYRPHAQTPMGAVTLALRRAAIRRVAGLARQTVSAIDANVPISDVRSMEQVMSESVARPRLIMALLLVFAGVGVILGAVGVYGVIAMRWGASPEIGVRIALGAELGRVAGAVLAQGVRYAAVGVAIGLAGSLAVTRVMRTLVFGVSTTDPLTFVGLSVFLVVVAALASYLPARQAARTDPMVALRAD